MVVPGFVITGAPAVLVILVILAILVLGVVTFFRLTARGAKRLVDHASSPDPAPAETRRTEVD